MTTIRKVVGFPPLQLLALLVLPFAVVVGPDTDPLGALIVTLILGVPVFSAWILGTLLERKLGRKRFHTVTEVLGGVLLLCGLLMLVIVASFFNLLVNPRTPEEQRLSQEACRHLGQCP